MQQIFARLAAASGTTDLARELERWVDWRGLRAFGLWRLDRDRGLLRPVVARGLPEGQALHAEPRKAGAPLWAALDASGPTPLADPPVGLDHLEVTLYPLRSGDLPVGIALCGRVAGADVDPCPLLTHLGPILARCDAADRDRQRSHLFDAAVALVDDGVIVATPDGVVSAYNPALERLTGWTAADVRQHGWTNLVYPDPAVRAEVQRGIAALTLGKASEGIVRTLARKDGTSVRASIWSRLAPDPAGGAPSMLGVLRDVTSEEAQRKRALRDESHARLGRLAGGIAHEFNNLLCAMMGHAELIALTPGLPASAAAHAETVVQGAQRGAHLSGQLLAFSGAVNTRAQPTDLAQIVRQSVDLWSPRLAPGISVELALSPTPRAEADENQVQQVLVNLLANAGEAMGAAGELRVSLDAAPAPATARYRAPDAPPPEQPMARIRVADTGPGFSPDALAHLFEPFYSGKDDGHGIGLAAVRGIVAAHGGAIDIATDRGAVVDVYLPLSERPELALPELVRGADARGERVWIVDDQVQVLEFTRISLDAHGYATRGYASVDEVLRAAEREPPPDVLVLDVVMPNGGGPAVLAGLRARGISAAVVWISGHTPDALQLPPVDGAFLQKPFTGRDLAAVIRRLLDTTDAPPVVRR